MSEPDFGGLFDAISDDQSRAKRLLCGVCGTQLRTSKKSKETFCPRCRDVYSSEGLEPDELVDLVGQAGKPYVLLAILIGGLILLGIYVYILRH